ncbi:MAG: sulfite exporter TauE/SafE family protein [Pseudomonadota bacterium]
MLALAILIIVCVLTYTVEITFGLAGTVLMLPLLSFWFDSKTLVVYSVMPQILTAGIGLSRSRGHVKIRIVAGMMATAVVGAFIGLWLFHLAPVDTFRILLAAAITAAGFYLVIAPHRVKLHPVAARLLDWLGGVSQGLFGISGPIIMTRLLATFEGKVLVRAYAFAFFLPLNVVRAVGYVFTGAYTPNIVEMMLFSAPFLVLALWYADRLHVHVNEKMFRRVVSWLILIGGLTLFYR